MRVSTSFSMLNTRVRYFVDNLPDDNVPYADFDAPKDSDNPKDSSATAIVASALFELFELTGRYQYIVPTNPPSSCVVFYVEN